MTVEATSDTSAVKLFDGAAQVLDAVRTHGCRSRAEIIEKTGLTRMVTGQRVQQLLDVGLLQEVGLGPSSGGRKPRQLIFQPPGHLLVADVGFTSIDAAVTDLRGSLIAHRHEPADITDGPKVILRRVEELFERMRDEHDTDDRDGRLDRLWGAGIGIPAPVEFETGRTISPPVGHGWDDYPVREQISERFGAPVWVDKDVNIMMLGEWQDGVARGHRNAAFVKCGTGLGISFISEGKLHRGALGCAGDLGPLLALAASASSSELSRVSSDASFWLAEAVTRRARELAETGASPGLAEAVADGRIMSPQAVAGVARNGDQASLDLLREAGALVGSTLAAVVSLFNPSLVVIGGGMSEAGDFFLAAIREVVYGRAIPLSTRDLRVVKAELGSKAGVVGAAGMVLDQLFSEDNLSDTVARWRAAAR